MADKNEVHFIGTVKGDPQVKFIKDNKSVCNFQVSATIGKSTTTLRFTAWDELAGKCGEYRDGDRVSIHGYIKNNSYVNKEGVKVWQTGVVVLGAAKEKAESVPKNAKPQDVPVPDDDESLPF